MKKIKVIEVERYRDGGTTVYEDSLHRRYYTHKYHKNKKVWNQMPDGEYAKPYVKEIPVELEIVDKL